MSGSANAPTTTCAGVAAGTKPAERRSNSGDRFTSNLEARAETGKRRACAKGCPP